MAQAYTTGQLNSLEAYASYVAIPESYVNENGNIDETEYEVLQVTASSGVSAAAPVSTTDFDPQEVFLLIQKEHEEAKAKLDEQKAVLFSQQEEFKRVVESHNNKIAEYQNEVVSLKMELESRVKRLEEMQTEVDRYKASSVAADGLMAKLMRAEEIIKQQDDQIRQFENHGFVEVHPQMLTDRFLADELEQKDRECELLRLELSNKQTELLKAQEANDAMIREMDEMKNLKAALESQVTLDETDMREQREEYEQQIATLRQEIARLKFVLNGENYDSENSYDENNVVNNLTTGTARNELATAGQTRHRCSHCQLSLDQDSNHPMSICPHFHLDNLD